MKLKDYELIFEQANYQSTPDRWNSVKRYFHSEFKTDFNDIKVKYRKGIFYVFERKLTQID